MRLLCITPRYGENVLGGAEAMIRGFAETAQTLGMEAHVLTSCALNAISWENELPSGQVQINGVQVWRYPLLAIHRPERYQQLYYQLMTHQPLLVDEQYEWLDSGPHCPQLYSHIARCGLDYDALVFSPYLFPMIHYGAAIYPQRSIIWPCLHDEAFARFESTYLMLNSALGIVYNAVPERDLASRKLGVDHPHSVIAGIGIESLAGDGARFRQRYNLHAPFVLYSGRLEPPKNIPLLIQYFLAYKREKGGDLKLVLMGEGTSEVVRHPDIVYIGFKQGQEKYDAYAAATLLCQPSTLESFSIVIMEAWLAGVPVLVHGDCAVTRFHCQHSHGGLYFASEEEFVECLDWLLTHPHECVRMGRQGRAYVRQNYTWQAVTQRVLDALQEWTA